jgi:hypothetical protein
VNVPPPDELKKTYDGTMTRRGDSEKATAKDAELARRAVARQFPDDPKTGKGIWGLLGIGKDKK